MFDGTRRGHAFGHIGSAEQNRWSRRLNEPAGIVAVQASREARPGSYCRSTAMRDRRRFVPLFIKPVHPPALEAQRTPPTWASSNTTRDKSISISGRGSPGGRTERNASNPCRACTGECASGSSHARSIAPPDPSRAVTHEVLGTAHASPRPGLAPPPSGSCRYAAGSRSASTLGAATIRKSGRPGGSTCLRASHTLPAAASS